MKNLTTYDAFKNSFNENQIKLLKTLFREEFLYGIIENNSALNYRASVEILIGQYISTLHDISFYKYLSFNQLSKILKFSPDEIEFLVNDFIEYQKYLLRIYDKYYSFVTINEFNKYKVAIDINGIQFVIGMWYAMYYNPKK